MCDTKLGCSGLPRFRIDCYFDRLVHYARPALCRDPFGSVGAENQFHLQVDSPGSYAFARIGTFYAQHADFVVAEHEVPIGHRTSGQALKQGLQYGSTTSRCVAVSSVSRLLLSRSAAKASAIMTMASSPT